MLCHMYNKWIFAEAPLFACELSSCFSYLIRNGILFVYLIRVLVLDLNAKDLSCLSNKMQNEIIQFRRIHNFTD